MLLVEFAGVRRHELCFKGYKADHFYLTMFYLFYVSCTILQ